MLVLGVGFLIRLELLAGFISGCLAHRHFPIMQLLLGCSFLSLFSSVMLQQYNNYSYYVRGIEISSNWVGVASSSHYTPLSFYLATSFARV